MKGIETKQVTLEGGPLDGKQIEVSGGHAVLIPVVPASLSLSAVLLAEQKICLVFDPTLGRYRVRNMEHDLHRYERRVGFVKGERREKYVHAGFRPVRDELWRQAEQNAS